MEQITEKVSALDIYDQMIAVYNFAHLNHEKIRELTISDIEEVPAASEHIPYLFTYGYDR